MARDVSTLTIELKAEDKASGVIDRVSGTIKTGLVAAVAVATAALASLAAAFRSAIPAASEQEDALKRLSNALSDLGPASEKVSAALVAQAEALQKTTRFSDDAIESGQAFAASFIKSEDSLKAVTQSAVDLATGLGIDLQTAFELLTKAAQGNTAAFSRYGLVLDENIPKGEKLAAIQQLIADKFGGRAQADVKTYSGALAQLSSAWGEVLEAIGDAVIKNTAIVDGIKSLTAALFAAVPRVAEFAKTIIDLGVSAAPAALKALQGLGAFLTTFALTTSLAAEGVVKLGRGILYLASLIPGLGSSFDGAAAALKRIDDSIDPFQQKAAALAGDLGRAALGIEDFGASTDAAVPGVDSLARGVGALAAAAERSGPAFTTYRTAAQLAAEAAIAAADATDQGSTAFESGIGSVDAYAGAIDGRLIPALQRAGAQAAATAAAVSGVFDRAGNELPAGGTLSMGGTRYELPGGGSRLVGFANGQRNPASNLGVNYRSGAPTNVPTGSPYSARFLTDTTQYGTIEAFKVASYGFGPSGAGVSTYGVLPGGRIVLLSER